MATTATWNNTSGGDWATGTNWTGGTGTGGVPSANDDVVISTAGAYTVTLAASEADVANTVSMTDAGATLLLNGNATLTVADNAGTITPAFVNNGTLDVDAVFGDGGGSLTVGGSVSGLLTNNSGGVVQIGNSTLGATTTASLGGLTNSSGAVFESFGASASVKSNVTVSGAISNAGTLDIGAFSTLTVSGSAGVTNNGTLLVASNSVLALGANSFSQTGGSTTVQGTVSGTSAITISGGTLTDNTTSFNAASLSVAAGGALVVKATDTLTLSGALSVAGVATVSGTVAAGSVSVNSGGTLKLNNGFSFGAGTVAGVAGATLELASAGGTGTLSTLGTNFTGFNKLTVDPGATWTVNWNNAALPGVTMIGNGALSTLAPTATSGTVNLTSVSKFGTVNLATAGTGITVTVVNNTLSSGVTVTINDGASGSGNTISAGTATAGTLIYNAKLTSDAFTGGGENDTVNVKAGTVLSDTLIGGGGTNTLNMGVAGTVNLTNVSQFGTVNLFAGTGSTVTVTDNTLSVGVVTINDGASGTHNSISATGDTASSTGKTLTYVATLSGDTFTGGFEKDVVNVTAATVGGDTLTGGTGANTLTLTTAGGATPFALNGVKNFGTINLAAGTSTVTSVTSTTLTGSVTINDGISGSNTINVSAGAGTNTLTYNANLSGDKFTGGTTEKDVVRVSAANVGGDTLAGSSSGANLLILTSAGTFTLAGVKNFGAINLVGSNNNVTVTNNTLTGAVTINDASGNTTINASGVSSGTPGTLLFKAGSGKDIFTGGIEADTVTVSAAAVGQSGESLNGGGGAGVNTLTITNAGTFSLLSSNISNFGVINLASGTNTVTADTVLVSGNTVNGVVGTLTSADTLILNSAGTVDLSNVSGFATIKLSSAGANNPVTVSSTTLTGTNTGVPVTITGGNAGNTVTATGSAGQQLIYVAGSGTDSFTGGAENDTVKVSAAAFSGDTLSGGGGTDTLTFTTAGSSITILGTSSFNIVNLAAGSSNVTVSGALSGAMTINDGASGNNLVHASGVTAGTLTFNAGSGADYFAGSIGTTTETDIVKVSAAAMGNDTLTGSLHGSNTLNLTSAGGFSLAGVSNFGTINLAAGNSTVTVTNNTLFGGAVTLNDSTSPSIASSNTINVLGAAGLSLTYVVGPNTSDTFNGGAENDTVNAGALLAGRTLIVHAGSGTDVLNGGTSAGTNKFFAGGNTSMTGSTAATATNQYDFTATAQLGAGNAVTNLLEATSTLPSELVFSNGTFGLGFTGASSTPTLWSTQATQAAKDFSTNTNGTFSSTTNRLAFNISNSELFFSANGTTAASQEVGVLTGVTTIANVQSHLYFVS